MSEYRIVAEYILNNLVLGGTGEFSKENLLKNCLKYCQVPDAEDIEGATKRDVVESLNLKCTFDYALPQSWFDSFMNRIGVTPLPHFVWDVTNNRPLPITKVGRELLKVYYHLYQWCTCIEDK